MGFYKKDIKAALHHIAILIMEAVTIRPTPHDKVTPWNSSYEF